MASINSNSNRWDFTIDKHINPWVPRPPWNLLPYPVSYFLGYRPNTQQKLGQLVIILWAVVGVFSGLTLIELVGQQIPSFQQHGTPLVIGSFGAAAVLEFYAIESPLAQPRNAVLSQLFASIIGVGIRKLFELGATSKNLLWLGGSLSCALATAVMAITGTIHPPAGATALLAVVDDNVARLSWFLLPVILLGCILMQCVALLVNNLQRKFPMYWWSPEDVGCKWIRCRANFDDTEARGSEIKPQAEVGISNHLEDDASFGNNGPRIIVSRTEVIVPEDMYMTPEELNFLEVLRERFRH